MLRTHFKAIIAGVVFVLVFAWFSSDATHIEEAFNFFASLVPEQKTAF